MHVRAGVLRFGMARGQVLVVDDEPSILSTLKKALSLEGYSVEVAGGVARQHVRAHRGRIPPARGGKRRPEANAGWSMEEW